MKQDLAEKTIRDFGQQWKKYSDNDGWYGSAQLFQDILKPLVESKELMNLQVAEIGSGTGRIVNMLLEAGVQKIYSIEPSFEAFQVLQANVAQMAGGHRVEIFNARGDQWSCPTTLDFVFLIGVIHNIPEAAPVIHKSLQILKPGGRIFLWVYAHEGNELYLKIFLQLRKVTTRLPHILLRIFIEILYGLLALYRQLLKFGNLPLKSYIENVLWPMSPSKRRLVIYDQLNPAFAKYYKKAELIELLQNAGFGDIKVYHRHGYSWSAAAQKP